MRPLTVPVAVLVLLFSMVFSAQAQQNRSDYEIYEDFKSSYSELEGEIDRLDRPAEADSLLGRISGFEEEYAPNEGMLDRALYPQTFRTMMTELRERARETGTKLKKISSLSEQVSQLDERLTAYNSQLQHLNSQADSLRGAMRKTTVEKRELEQLGSEYRKSIEQRDQFIMSVVDSLLITYEDLGPRREEEIRRAEGGDIQRSANALDLVRRIAAQNAEFLTGSAQLNVEDYLRMRRVQSEFSEMWTRLDDELLRLYGEDENSGREINQSLEEWNNRLGTQMWLAINQEFQSRNIPMAEVNSSGQLYEELNTYLSESLEKTEDNPSDSLREAYLAFNRFWSNEVQARWSEYMADAGVLSHGQMAAIDRNLDDWALRSQPESNLYAYLFGASMFLWLITGLLLVRRNKS